MEPYHLLLILVAKDVNVNITMKKPGELIMAKSTNIRQELSKMSKEQLMRQIEFYQKDLQIKDGNALRYYQAYNLLMDYWDYIPDSEKKKAHKKLKNMGL